MLDKRNIACDFSFNENGDYRIGQKERSSLQTGKEDGHEA